MYYKIMDRHYCEPASVVIKKNGGKKERPTSAGPSRKVINDNDFSDIRIPETCKSLGIKLQQVRLARKENQKQFAPRLQLKDNIYKEIESGKAVLSSQQIQSINNKLHKLN